MATKQLQPPSTASRLRSRSTMAEDADELALLHPSKRRIVESVSQLKNVASSTNEKVVELNQAAMRLFLRGVLISAQELFSKALSLLQTDPAYPSVVEQTFVDREEAPKESYIYQRIHFDEGMEVYTGPEPVSVDDDLQTLVAALYFNIGQVKHKLGDLDSASRFFESALQALLDPVGRMQMLQPQNVLSGDFRKIIVPILHSLGLSAYRRGRLTTSVAFYKAALKQLLALSTKDDLSEGATLNCLGVLYYHMGSEAMDQAITSFHAAHRIFTGILGTQSSAVATTLNNLGRAMVQEEQSLIALRFYEQALEIRRACSGENHIDYAAIAFNTGQSLHQLGEYERAILLYNEFLRVASSRLSTNHRDIAIVLSCIAQIHQKCKEDDKAQEMFERSLRVGRAALGNKHPEIAMLLNRVGNFYFEKENYSAALRAYKEGLRIEKETLGTSHPNIVITLSNIGEIYRQNGQFGRAIKRYMQVIELQKKLHGAVSAQVAGTLNVLGLIHDQNGDSEKALSRLQEALVVRRTVLGDNHLDVAATLTYLGTLFYRKHMISTALTIFSESLRIRSAALGLDHRDVSFTLYNIGLCYQMQDDHKEAIEFFRQALRIEKQVLGKEHKDVALTLLKLGEAYKAEGNLDSALESFNSALRIEKQLPQKEDPTALARIHNEIGNVHLARGDVKPMMDSFTKAARLFRREGRLISSVIVSPVLKLYAAGFGNCAEAA